MSQLDDIKAELDTLVSNVDTFIADAQAALANGDPVKAAAILSELQAENAKVVAALASVTPPPAP